MIVTSVNTNTEYLSSTKINCLMSVLGLQYYTSCHLPSTFAFMFYSARRRNSFMVVEELVRRCDHPRVKIKIFWYRFKLFNILPSSHEKSRNLRTTAVPLAAVHVLNWSQDLRWGGNSSIFPGTGGRDCEGFWWCPPQCRLWSSRTPEIDIFKMDLKKTVFVGGYSLN